MSNKTCGECKYYMAEMYHCQKNDVMAEDFNTCEDFDPKVITNGDRIRQMSNEDLATAWSEQAFLFAWCYDCMEYCKDGSTPENELKCKNRMLNWLNTPSGSGVCVAKKRRKCKTSGFVLQKCQRKRGGR